MLSNERPYRDTAHNNDCVQHTESRRFRKELNSIYGTT
jgi:hypothetical protein